MNGLFHIFDCEMLSIDKDKKITEFNKIISFLSFFL
jgi:hypothetical protein